MLGLEFHTNIFTALICCWIIKGNCPVYHYIAEMGVGFLIPRVDLIICKAIFYRSLTVSPVILVLGLILRTSLNPEFAAPPQRT